MPHYLGKKREGFPLPLPTHLPSKQTPRAAEQTPRAFFQRALRGSLSGKGTERPSRTAEEITFFKALRVFFFLFFKVGSTEAKLQTLRRAGHITDLVDIKEISQCNSTAFE